MKILSSYIFRALCALIIGFLLVSNPEKMTTLLVQIIGGLFAFSGVLAVIGYFVNSHQLNRRRQKAFEAGEEAPRQSAWVPMFPVVGIGSLAFGIFLLMMPVQFVNILMYVLGFLMALGGATQIISLIRFRQVVPLTWSAFVLPLVILAAGIYVLLQPQESASLPFVILGIASICYGATEFFNGLRLHRYMKRVARAQAEAEAASEAEYIEFEEIKEEPEDVQVVEVVEAESDDNPEAPATTSDAEANPNLPEKS